MFKKINFIYETKKWSIFDDGLNIKKYNDDIILSKYPIIIPFYIKLIHFGSVNLLFKFSFLLPFFKKINIKIVCSWFHIDDTGKNFNDYYMIYKYVDIWHVTNEEIKNFLIGFGINKNKIKIINLGFDNQVFYKYQENEVKAQKKNYNIPNKLVIGSFVKDSPGFGNSLDPKSIKRPDLFIEIVKKINEREEIFVLLTGPSRGYILEKLKENKINHKYIGNISKKELSTIMNLIDINLISSLREGGPKSVIESSSCGKFILSTFVGMVPQIVSKYKNGFLYNDINDFNVDKFFEQYKNFNGVIDMNNFISEYSWKSISKEYVDKLYS